MAVKAYGTYQTKQTPQSGPIPNKKMSANSAGGYSFAVNDWKRLDRFLILGAEGGTYYIGEKKLVKENADGVLRCIQSNGRKTVDRIVEISDEGRAPKNDPALFALAMCAGLGDNDTRKYALESLPKVARIGTHLFAFSEYVQQFRGWGRGLRNAIGNWYNRMPADKLVYQAVKYQQRNGWSSADLLRLSHPIPQDEAHKNVYKWMVDGEYPIEGDLIWAFTQAKLATDRKVIVSLIRDYRLPREAIPTQFLKEAEVWEALLEDMPMTALIRNLGNISKVGLLSPMSGASQTVYSRLVDAEKLQKARVHPIQILIASKTYESGHGNLGHGEWTVVPKIVDALDSAFYLSFGNVEPTNKRFYLGMDISGSMWGSTVAGVNGLNAAVASGAMALVTAKSETNYYAAGFTSASRGQYGGMWGGNVAMTPISLSSRERLDDVLEKMQSLQSRMGGTDCALPMIDALEKKIPVDVFVIYTDSETWAGNIHPVQALQNYRQKMGIPAKMVVVGMTSNGFSIADPSDAGMLDVVGFDTATPTLMNDFAANRV